MLVTKLAFPNPGTLLDIAALNLLAINLAPSVGAADLPQELGPGFHSIFPQPGWHWAETNQ